MNASARVKAALQRFDLLHQNQIELGLDRLLNLLAKLDNPHLDLPPVVHVAGSNGKGSTIAFLRAMAEANGLRTHVHTSPHLLRLNERFVVAGQEISDSALADILEQIERINQGAPATVFELLTAAMFVVFHRTPADLAIIEVGLGGELDATNVIDRVCLSLLTPISLEHTEWLGTELAQIARAKAGIIKQNCPVISANQPDEVREQIERIAYRKQALVGFVGDDIQCRAEDGRLIWQDETQLLDLPLPALQGNWQIDNAGLAIAAAMHLDWPKAAIAQGLQQVSWPGRLQRLRAFAPLTAATEVWLDGAHNPQAAKHLAQFVDGLHEHDPAQLHMIFSVQASKDLSAFLQAFLPLCPTIHVVPLSGGLAPVPVATLTEQINQLGFRAIGYCHLSEALAAIPDGKTRLLITGSLYLVAEVLAISQQKTPAG